MMKTRILKLVATSVVAAGTVAASMSAQAADPEKFSIGAILAMTGSSPQYGKVMSEAIQLAIDETNDAGGIDGIPLELHIVDHQSGSSKEAVAGMNRIISLYNVQAVLSSFSGPTLAIAPIADREKVFVINGGGTSAKLVNASKYMVHNRVLGSELAHSIVNLAKERGFKRAALIHRKNESGDSVKRIIQEIWPGEGRELVAVEPIAIDAANIDTQVAKAKASRPDVVFLALWQPDTGLAVKRVRELKIDVPILGVDWTQVDGNIAGEHSEGYEYVLESFNPTDANPWAQHFSEAYEAKYGEKPDLYAANYYEGAHVIIELIRRAKGEGGDYWSGDKLYDSMWDNSEFKSVFGPTMVFDKETGLASKPLNLFRADETGAGQFVDYVGN